MVEPVYHKEKIMIIGNRLREIRQSVNKNSQMSLRVMIVLAHMYMLRIQILVLKACNLTKHESVSTKTILSGFQPNNLRVKKNRYNYKSSITLKFREKLTNLVGQKSVNQLSILL